MQSFPSMKTSALSWRESKKMKNWLRRTRFRLRMYVILFMTIYTINGYSQMLPMPAEGWPSQLLPLDIDPSHVITRSRVVRVRAGENEWKAVGRPSQHCHPYRKFGLIRTHVNPFFRIADAYTKNLKLRSFWTKKQLKAVELVTHIMAVWLVPAPHDFLERARVKRAERAEKLKERRARRRTKKNDQPEAGPSNHRASEDPSPSPLSNL